MPALMVDIGGFRGQFFEVLQETTRSQTAVMTIGPGEEAGPEETHAADQIIYVVEGEAVVRVEGTEYRAAPGHLLLVPAGARHHVKNPGECSFSTGAVWDLSGGRATY
jgi:mannose-6-phosphate isomerase-like protein (cupin superfamily)